jgi:uncharacterized membrane protein YphA (DoxX/SURF4 family)
MPLLHVKWFTDPSAGKLFSFAQPEVIVWIVIALLLVLTASILDRKIPGPKKAFLKKVKKWDGEIVGVFQVLLGASLIGAALKGSLLVPHFELLGDDIFKWLQIVAGLLLALNLWPFVGAAIVILCFLAAAALFGVVEVMDYLNLVGAALFIIIWRNKKYKGRQELAVKILAFLSGVTLVVLAFSEKILQPQMALEFLDNYDFNFMQSIALFTDELFVLSTGVMEMVFGLILALGFIPRINIAVLALFFLATNGYMFLSGHVDDGITELVGHLPVIATVIVVLAFGAGKWKKGRK